MTSEELERLERKWTHLDPIWGNRTIDTDPESVEQIAAESLALVAEVRRLRALVEAAYREGFFSGEGMDSDMEWTDWHEHVWQVSEARRALDADKTPQDGVS